MNVTVGHGLDMFGYGLDFCHGHGVFDHGPACLIMDVTCLIMDMMLKDNAMPLHLNVQGSYTLYTIRK